jgi:hypothetical protein
MRRNCSILCILLAVSLSSEWANASDDCNDVVPHPINWDPLPDENSMYMICQQDTLDAFRQLFHMDAGNWGVTFGSLSPCNDLLPLGRTFAAMWALLYSHGGPYYCYPTANMLEWGACYSWSWIDELDGMCGNVHSPADTQAWTQFGPFINNYTNLYWPFFYGASVVERASILVHEARHEEAWCSHTSNSACTNGASCDYSWEQGCSGRIMKGGHGETGANRFQVSWLWAYVKYATWTTAAAKANAMSVANHVLMTQYQIDPCFIFNEAADPIFYC